MIDAPDLLKANFHEQSYITGSLNDKARLIVQAKIMGCSCRKVKPMAVRQPRYGKKEFAQRGDEIYESQIRQQVEEGNRGKIVAINIETGDFEVDESEIAACDRLEARQPDAQIWMVRIGSGYVRRFGGRTRRTT